MISTEEYKTVIGNLTPASTTCDDHEDEWIAIESISAKAVYFAGMEVSSASLRNVITTIVRMGPYKATVLIEGESGTGKDLVANAMHKFGPMPKGPFVTFNCSNLVESLAEAQLFGHVRGAFTGAQEDSLGYFRSANGGTLFLDELGEMPLALQPKLLRVVETLEVQPVGASRSHKIDVRLVAATNRDLAAMVKAGQFRGDLYHRLNAISIRIPALREREDAVPGLLGHFVECYNRLFGKQVRFISRRALDLLDQHQWPGNVREFANSIQAAVIFTSRDRICIGDFPPALRGQIVGGTAVTTNEPVVVQMADCGRGSDAAASRSNRPEGALSLDAAIKAALLRALEETGHNYQRAAQILGVSRYTVYRMVARYGLQPRNALENRGLRAVAMADHRPR